MLSQKPLFSPNFIFSWREITSLHCQFPPASERVRPTGQESGEDRRAARAAEEAEPERAARRRQADAPAPQGGQLRPGEGRRGHQGVPRLQTEHARQ